MNPKYWDDADAGDVQDAYGEDWEKVKDVCVCMCVFSVEGSLSNVHFKTGRM